MAERLGARDARLYLAEVDQRRLVPLPVGDEILEPLDIDGTLAGRAYQTSATTASMSGSRCATALTASVCSGWPLTNPGPSTNPLSAT